MRRIEEGGAGEGDKGLRGLLWLRFRWSGGAGVGRKGDSLC